MSILLEDFAPYFDGNDLLAPNPVPPGTLRGSDNGPMFTSEYFLICNRNAITFGNVFMFNHRINICTDAQGYLVRAPGDDSRGNPDNHVAVYAASVELNTPITFKFYWQLLRMPQLLFAHLCAKQVVKWYKPWQWPLSLITAILIKVSCTNVPKDSTDERRLAWFLIIATRKYSFLCRLASKVYFTKLYKDYPTGMKEVNAIYFQPHGIDQNPYSKWVIT